MSLREDVEKIEKKVDVFEQESFAMEILKDYKKANKRQFIIILVILSMWFATIGYLVYLLNDIGTTETSEIIDENYDVNQNSGDDGNNNFITGNDNEVNNG